MKNLVVIVCTALILQSCASWLTKNEQVPPVEEPPAVAEAAPAEVKAEEPGAVEATDEEPMTKYSDLNNMAPPSDRQYKRMTRQRMEEESQLYGSAGSLWKMEGQTSFLFAENKHRREGDPTAIKMEGSALKTIESKVAVIQDLMKELEIQKKQAEEDAKKAEEQKLRLAQEEEEKKIQQERIAKGEAPADFPADFYAPEPEPVGKREPAEEKKPVVAEKEEKIDLKELEFIPSRIVEKTEDGMYRIRGQQFLTIKKKPYKVIATALVRPEDFNDQNVSSTKLLDAQYDVLHVKKGTAE